MGWFKKKPAWEATYAERIYEGLVAHNDFGDMTALKLRIPTTAHQAYQNKILLQREMICFMALMEAANPETAPNLQPVMLTFGDLLVKKLSERGIQMNRDQLASAATDDVAAMIADPSRWAQRWLAEFRHDPSDNYMVAMFADHCLRLHNAYKHSVETTRPK
jgi:hypothetical protein